MKGDDQALFQLAVPCSGSKLSFMKGLEILTRVKCSFSGGVGVGGDRKLMQMPFIQNKMKVVMNYYRKKI